MRLIYDFGEFKRLVRRNPKAVPHVLVNGKIAVRNGELDEIVGKERGYGSVLRCSSGNS